MNGRLLRQALEGALGALAEPMQFPLTPGEWGAAEGAAQLQSVRDAADAIARAGSQREILTALLDSAAAFYPRTALFILKGGALVGWAGLGFLGEGGFKSDDLPRVTLAIAGDHLPANAVRRRSLARAGTEGPGQEVVGRLGGVRPRAASAVPLVVRGRPVAVLYGDTGAGAGPSSQGLGFEIVARFAGLAMERITAAPAALPTRAGASAPGPAGGQDESAARGTGPRSGAPTPPEEAEMQALLSDLDSQPRRRSGDDGVSEEERRRHADARRFAHLLVSELLLYNEEAVVQGRKHRDLQERLRKEIERSRQAYQARAAGLPLRGPDYFEDELVRQLALGDPALLGS